MEISRRLNELTVCDPRQFVTIHAASLVRLHVDILIADRLNYTGAPSSYIYYFFLSWRRLISWPRRRRK